MNTALHAYVKRPNGPTYTSRANPGSYRSSDVLVIGATPISARRTAQLRLAPHRSTSMTLIYLILGVLNPVTCPTHQHWTFIPEAGIYACTMKET